MCLQLNLYIVKNKRLSKYKSSSKANDLKVLNIYKGSWLNKRNSVNLKEKSITEESLKVNQVLSFSKAPSPNIPRGSWEMPKRYFTIIDRKIDVDAFSSSSSSNSERGLPHPLPLMNLKSATHKEPLALKIVYLIL